MTALCQQETLERNFFLSLRHLAVQRYGIGLCLTTAFIITEISPTKYFAMKAYFLLILMGLLPGSCDSETATCVSGQGDRVQGVEAEARFDERFNQLVLWRHVPGTIDGLETFIPCNPPAGLEAGSMVLFDGLVEKLPREKEPLTLVAGEEFFVVQLSMVDKDPGK